jgi:hypothetical protein
VLHFASEADLIAEVAILLISASAVCCPVPLGSLLLGGHSHFFVFVLQQYLQRGLDHVAKHLPGGYGAGVTG